MSLPLSSCDHTEAFHPPELLPPATPLQKEAEECSSALLTANETEEVSYEDPRSNSVAENVPTEVLHEILSQLGPRDLAVCGAVCSTWRVVATDPLLWCGLTH